VIAVSRAHFAEWIKFAEGMTVKLACDRQAVDAWWRRVSMRAPKGFQSPSPATSGFSQPPN
jgi:hypothetical protein